MLGSLGWIAIFLVLVLVAFAVTLIRAWIDRRIEETVAKAPRGEDPVGQMRALAELRDSGSLTADEFKAAKKALLNRL